MRPLGLAKTRHKVAGHGDCPICIPMTRKEVRRWRPRDFNVARTGRAREHNRRLMDDDTV